MVWALPSSMLSMGPLGLILCAYQGSSSWTCNNISLSMIICKTDFSIATHSFHKNMFVRAGKLGSGRVWVAGLLQRHDDNSILTLVLSGSDIFPAWIFFSAIHDLILALVLGGSSPRCPACCKNFESLKPGQHFPQFSPRTIFAYMYHMHISSTSS